MFMSDVDQVELMLNSYRNKHVVVCVDGESTHDGILHGTPGNEFYELLGYGIIFCAEDVRRVYRNVNYDRLWIDLGIEGIVM